MVNLIKKDMRVNFSNNFTIIIILFYFPLILLNLGAENTNMLFMFSGVSFAFILAIIPFAYEIKDKCHIFIQSLPVTKKDIVISKYISIFINCVVGIVYTFVYMWIFNLIGLINMNIIGIPIILSTLGFTILVLSISLPMQFRFTSMTANFLNMFFYMLIIIFIMRSEDIFFRILNLDLNNVYTILGIVGGLIGVYFLSMAISISLYKTRKFY